ncbi:MAG: SLC13 family permease [Planctomycetes bacterium]|jgi:Na+/H+ antiporter NhaD/arsenite permease-like protein|nr:SLC13 family permease [Planctomycetota bacterium]
MTDVLLFGLFAATLLGIARYHQYALRIALGGLVATLLVRLALTEFALGAHLHHEWRILTNLAGLLLGFSILADYFERSHLPERLTVVLPPGKKGAFALLVLVACLSAVLDNIAAALIGGSAAITLFRRKVHIGYLAAIVAASNAGGAGSVIGDTTTTMMWIEGASPLWVAKAAIGAAVALAFFGVFASAQQNRLQPLVRSEHAPPPVDLGKVLVVLLIIVGAVSANVGLDFPAAGVWAAILLGGLFRAPNWKVLPSAAHGTLFLCSLVLTASMMPVESLPDASPWTSLGLGFVSAFFDNIPLTKLAIDQGGHDWGLLAYAVGYGGSMLWFGSSAGVAISGLFHEAKSAKAWLVNGWHVAVGYVLGFVAMFLLFGWQPRELPKKAAAEAPPAAGSHR